MGTTGLETETAAQLIRWHCPIVLSARFENLFQRYRGILYGCVRQSHKCSNRFSRQEKNIIIFGHVDWPRARKVHHPMSLILLSLSLSEGTPNPLWLEKCVHKRVSKKELSTTTLCSNIIVIKSSTYTCIPTYLPTYSCTRTETDPTNGLGWAGPEFCGRPSIQFIQSGSRQFIPNQFIPTTIQFKDN